MMQILTQTVLRFLREEQGVVGIEYGLLAMLIALSITAGAGLLGTGLSNVFMNFGSCFDSSAGGTCPVPLPDGVKL